MICPSCETENRPEARFCRACGTSLGGTCPQCGAPVDPGQRFCDSCGHTLRPGQEQPRAEPIAERRHVSVLFADLVGFTGLSQSRDAEEVRELLSRYFDSCRRLVERYGGSIEKFIGDAVMAVWGAPTANEDDAERAVRAALDLVAAVSGLADELGIEELRLRAGVLSGEAAVTLGAPGEGMVAGDLVNTASRIQAAAEPGSVLVGEGTRRATEAAIAYEDVGFRRVKGKTEPVHLYRALRVIAARRGEGRGAGLEPPFVGREREFRLIKELFHDCAEQRRSRLVSITGMAGIGKSRLSWEFEKYVDGLVEEVRWHRGRCLAYGEGVAYWALAEMVRMRARITEEDGPEPARAKLAEALVAIVPDARERQFLEPRLAHLLGLAERTAPDKEDLFSAWRLFFERLAERNPVVLVFEDLQWADGGLLDFVEYLLDWSRAFPIYVLTLSRPELSERRSGWGVGRRDFTSLFLEPLSPSEVNELLCGLAPGLPDELRGRIVERADGVPLYAVETVRMLLDRGLLRRSGDEYRPAGPIETLEIPETLQALAAARLDALEPADHRLVEDAAVLGKTFSAGALAALAGLSEEEVEPRVQSLLRKEILTIQTDPFSPERNQLSFMQDLLRRVAYETLSLRERKARHLAAARLLAAEHEGDDEVAGLVASHYLEAYRAAAGDPDAASLKEMARESLTRAGERAISMASAGEASGRFAAAAELADDPIERAELLERAGRAAGQDVDIERALALLEEAASLLEEAGDERAAARVAARRAEVLRYEDRVEEALTLMKSAFDRLATDEPSADLALVAAQLARLAYFAAEPELAEQPIEMALEIAESLELPEALAEALNTKGMLHYRRPHESEALLRESLRLARQHDLTSAALRAQFNLSGLYLEHDRLPEARAELDDALTVARVRGDRTYETAVLGQLADVLLLLGEWDEAAALFGERERGETGQFGVSMLLLPMLRLLVWRGQVEEGDRLLVRSAELRNSTDRQTQAAYELARATLRQAQGRHGEVLEVAAPLIESWQKLRQSHYAAEAITEIVEAALSIHDLDRAEQLLADAEALPPIERRRLLTAQCARFRARLAALRGDDEAAATLFADAAARFRELQMQFWLGVTLLERAEHALADDPDADAARAEAEQIFVRLSAEPWLARARAVTTTPSAEPAPAGADRQEAAAKPAG